MTAGVWFRGLEIVLVAQPNFGEIYNKTNPAQWPMKPEKQFGKPLIKISL
jgi:hypothetical protein